jgi:ASC-1-like (ASCH) protein
MAGRSETKKTKKKIRKVECGEPWFDLIKQGRKTVEGRRNSSFWASVTTGEVLHFWKPDPENNQELESFQAEVVKINAYKGNPTIDPLSDYLTTEGLIATLPGISSIEEGRQVYLKFYSHESIVELGMLAIHVKVLSPTAAVE